MRLFVGIFPPPTVVERVSSVVAAARDGDDGSVRWTLPAQWHISLTFLGEVPEANLPQLRRSLARVAGRHGPFELTIAGAGAFGSRHRARVVWAGIAGDVEPLRGLAESVAAGARHRGIAVENRPFRAHLTLGRLREPTDVTGLIDELDAVTTPAWTVGRFDLVRSHLGQGEGRRSRYKTVESWTLGGGG